MKTTAASMLFAFALFFPGAHAVTFDWATVGNPGNASDSEVMNDGTTGYGSVGYAYRISKHEVTNAQYAEFLNAVDPTGANLDLGGGDGFLYDSNMSGNFGGIENTGTVDGAHYVAQTGREQNPVTHVSFFDAMRFVNWLHNGQGGGGTESGVYTIGTGLDEIRSTNAKFWIPSEDEWYKAAHYDPSGVYYDYPTGTDTVPYSDNPASLNTPDDTNVANFYKNDAIANGYDDGYAVSGSTSFPTNTNPFIDVGAYTAAASPYGTFDQGGNVTEWNESVTNLGLPGGPYYRGIRGGRRSTSQPATVSFCGANFGTAASPRRRSASMVFAWQVSLSQVRCCWAAWQRADSWFLRSRARPQKSD
ncbi:formylglycine-generating enzyme family protein [Aeoliella sp. ICT_H6.2]|uniref:Formylglycine-generating enzyme family protein n=1 Tax=Aeoliella straminimaris TaxID=2954799 RepID=A0A9X2JEP3_9BACT|nr:SUMF1/EgtB/PvdO family nonheme iron enzyme [Aeoliella straminimaris]MCO6042881.1 formylglycine-generating enzyme family protein [Aeoliella straminimaris]